MNYLVMNRTEITNFPSEPAQIEDYQQNSTAGTLLREAAKEGNYQFIKKRYQTGELEVGIEEQKTQRTVSQSSLDNEQRFVKRKQKVASILVNAYIEKVLSYLDIIERDMDDLTAMKIVGLSHKYLRSLNSFPESRIFIGTISQTIGNSRGQLDYSRVQTLVRGIKDFSESDMSRADSKQFTKMLLAAGLSPVLV